MRLSGVFLVLLLRVVPSGFFHGKSPARTDCPHFSRAVSPGDSVNIPIRVPTNVSEIAFYIQKYNTSTNSWKDIILCHRGDSELLLSSFKEKISFSGEHFNVKNMSKEAEGDYRIVGHMYRECIAVVNLTKQELESSTATSGTSGAVEEPHNEAKKKEVRYSWLWIVLVVPVTFVVLLIFLFLIFGSKEKRGNLRAFPSHLFSKLTHLCRNTASSQQTEDQRDSQETEEVTTPMCTDIFHESSCDK